LLLSILSIFGLLAACAFFAGSETAFISANRFRLHSLRKKGAPGARPVYYLLEKPERLLSTTLIGTNIALVLASNLTALLYTVMLGRHRPLLSLLTITVISLVFCEVLPKNAALKNNIRWSLVSGPLMYFFYILFFPAGKIFSFLAWIVMRIMGIHTGEKHGLFRHKDDVRFFLTANLEPRLTKDESRYFTDSLEFSEKTLSDIMTPLVEIKALPATADVRECIDFVREYGRSSIPIYNTRIDNIIGIVYSDELIGKDRHMSVSDIMHEPAFFPESKNLGELYRELYQKKIPTVFAVDEFGGITGLATIYDIGEEVAGRITGIEQQNLIMEVRRGEYICSGDVEIDDINNLLSISISHQNFTTLNGLLTKILGKIPESGNFITVQGFKFIVEQSSKKKAELVRIKKVT